MKKQNKGKRPKVSEVRQPASRGLINDKQPTSNPYCKREIPIHHGGMEIGTVHFAFTYSKEINGLNKSKTLSYPDQLRRGAFDFQIYSLCSYLTRFIKEDFELGLASDFHKTEQRSYDFIVYLYYHPDAFDRKEEPSSSDTSIVTWKVKPSIYTIDEEAIFEIIREIGPAALRQGQVQDALVLWLGNKKTASEKMGKLKTALLRYSLGSIDKPFDPGRPKSKALCTSSEQWIKDMYKEISEVLKIAKQRVITMKRDLSGKSLANHEKSLISELRQRTDEPYITAQDAKRYLKHKTPDKKEAICEGPKFFVSINDAYDEYLTKLEERNPDSAGLAVARKPGDRADRLGYLRHMFANVAYDPITAALRHKPDLKEEFEKQKYQPNELAKRIVGELLGISVSKLTKILY